MEGCRLIAINIFQTTLWRVGEDLPVEVVVATVTVVTSSKVVVVVLNES